ncbi:MAG: beta-galactosidase [Litoreibacter sp.]
MKRTLGVCYYPEHWPEDMWADDARRMIETGLSWVRIGEFSWSRLEPSDGMFDFAWLDRAIEVLGDAGLRVILGTPTTTPPKWICDKYPDMFAVDAMGHTRGFGSRRHYCFSHQGYREEARRITEVLAKRYARNPHIAAWQVDNEYGCHDTVLSYSNAARIGFRTWLANKYQSIDALNRAWGNVFWSMEYGSFDEIELPNLSVTEVNPSHDLAFRRYSSDQVVAFNLNQVQVLREHTNVPLIHNYMGRETKFDHFDVGADLDIASWDSYPLGFLEDRLEDTDAHKVAFSRQGDPDLQAFHHDLYRAVGRGRWWIMEQQPGPVNWAPVNPAPLPGMCRLWAWEAFAHGAETVCYFRWRQAPFAQEQMHAGMLRPDNIAAPALSEAATVADELTKMPEVGTAQAKVALIFDYASDWAWDVQSQGSGFNYFRLCLEMYRGLRKLGLDIDIVGPDIDDLSSYALVLAPGLLSISDTLSAALMRFEGIALIGPRSNSKTDELCIPLPLPPNIPGLDATIAYVESIRADVPRSLRNGGAVKHWVENISTTATVHEMTEDGAPILIGDQLRYLGAWPDEAALDRLLRGVCAELGVDITPVADGLRIRRSETHLFAFNYGSLPVQFGDVEIPPAGVHWHEI